MDWNELEFLSWQEFKQMAPSIVQLEISRIGKLMQTAEPDIECRNALVKTRFEMKKFIACLNAASDGPLDEACASHLRTAILTLTTLNENRLAKESKTIDYILDRLQYVYNRSRMLF